MIDLAPEHLDLVREILARYLPGRRIVVFGSRAGTGGRAKPFSDLDLCIMGPTALTLSELADLREAFVQSALPFRVDLVEWTGMSDSFREIVKAQAVEIDRGG